MAKNGQVCGAVIYNNIDTMKRFFLALAFLAFIVTSHAQDVEPPVEYLPSVNLLTKDSTLFNTKNISNGGKPILICFSSLNTFGLKSIKDVIENYEEWFKYTHFKFYFIGWSWDKLHKMRLAWQALKCEQFVALQDYNKEFLRALNIKEYPFYMVLDGTGKVTWAHVGIISYEEDCGWDKVFLELLKAK